MTSIPGARLVVKIPGTLAGLSVPESPMFDAGSAETLRALVAKGAMPPLVLEVNDVQATYEAMKARGIEFTQEPVARFGSVDAGFRDPSGNGWKLAQSRRAAPQG